MPAKSCKCTILTENFRTEILAVTTPIIICYGLLILFGVGNLIRFIRVKQISKSLIEIYTFSLLSCAAWALDLAFAERSNLYQYVPFATGVYLKILFGISYQSSIFDLKYVVMFCFRSEKLEMDE